MAWPVRARGQAREESPNRVDDPTDAESRAKIEDRPSEDETALLEEHAKTPYFWLAWVHVALFSIGVTEWIAPSEAWNGFWRPFGNLGVMIAFGSIAVVNLFLYWSSIGSRLDKPQSTSGGETRRRII